MEKQTVRAIWGSIEKWVKIIRLEGWDEQANNCPLCALFYTKRKNHCLGCPIFLATGARYCRNTPYDNWDIHQEGWHPIPNFERSIICPTCLPLARKELAFLQSLLPKREREKKGDRR